MIVTNFLWKMSERLIKEIKDERRKNIYIRSNLYNAQNTRIQLWLVIMIIVPLSIEKS